MGVVAQMVARLWGKGARVELAAAGDNPQEAGFLRLDSSKAREELGWGPRWSLAQALGKTVTWHPAWMQRTDMMAFSLGQIGEYEVASPQ